MAILTTTTKPKQKRRRTWPHVYSRTNRGGQASYVVDLGLINGKRERLSFKTKGEADSVAEQKRTEKLNQGTAALSLPYEIKVAAAKAHSLLAPHDVTLIEAAEYYLDHVIAYRNAPKIKELVERMVTEAEKNDRRDRTVLDLKNRLNTFADEFSDTQLSELTVDDIKDWLNDNSGWSARTRINYLTKISQLFNYAVKHKWVDVNLAERIDRPSPGDSEPEIFTVEQSEKMLKNAKGFGLLPYISLGLFAGLRSAELLRLDGKDVNLEERAIIVGKHVAKKRSRRVVEICDALYGWLKTCKTLKGPIVNASEFRDKLEELKVVAGIKTWPNNGLRHSFGSYHLALYGDAVKTANQMGHRSSDVVHNHYKTLVLRSEAEKFWAIKPTGD